MFQHITLTRTGPVIRLTLNRPEVHNAFHAQLIGELHAACELVAGDTAARVLVLAGNGPSFCAGADLNWMRQSLDYSHEENIADAERLDALFAALDTLPLAVVAQVHGAVMGGGLGLLACCDMVISADNARFAFSEARLGLLPAVIARYVIPRIGAGHTRALFVSAQVFDAAYAHMIGMVQRIVPATELESSVDQTIGALLRCGPQAIAACKALVRAVTTLPADAARRYAIEAIATARTGPEGQEGLRAFLAKRQPTWNV